jgi:ribosomal protein L7/L12
MRLQLVVTLLSGVTETHNLEDVQEYHIVGDAHAIKPPWWGEVIDFLMSGKKVNAIKAHRAATGMGLKESKGVVDVIHNGLIRDGVISAEHHIYCGNAARR